MLDLLASTLAAAALSESKRSNTPPPTPDVILARLGMTAQLYAKPVPFTGGALVTPRADGNMTGAGDPHVVIEILDGVDCLPADGPSWSPPVVLRDPSVPLDKASSSGFGRVLDMRVAVLRGGAVLTFLVESQDLEAWTPAHEEAWRAKLAKEAAGPQPLTLSEAVSALRDRAAGKEVRAERKVGDTVEIVPEPRGAEAPMSIEGKHVGIVQKVDASDGTTNVLYHAASTGRIGTGWLRNADLSKWGPKAAETPAAALAETATA